MRGEIVANIFCSCACTSGWGFQLVTCPIQSSVPTRRTRIAVFKLLSEDEDWGFLRDPTLRQDFWDPIKYIRLRKGLQRLVPPRSEGEAREGLGAGSGNGQLGAAALHERLFQ